MKKWHIVSSVVALSVPTASGERVTGELEVTPESTTEVTQTIVGVGSDSATAAYTGTLVGEVEIDGESGAVSEMMLAPSRLVASDLTLRVPIGGGFHVQTAIRGVSSLVSSGGVFLPVSPQGEIGPGGLTQTIDRGTATTTSSVPGVSPVVVDYSVTPRDVPNTGTGRITSTLESETEFVHRWRLSFQQTVDETVSQSVGGLTIRVSERGAIAASGLAETTTAYGRWLGDNGLPELPYAGPNPVNRIANGILFALKLPVEPGVEVPLSPHPEIATGWVLDLPASESAAALVLERSSGLTPTGWETHVSIPAGETGPVLLISHQPVHFFRVTSPPP